MKKYFLALLLMSIFLACSKDEEVNSAPSDFTLDDLSFTGSKLNLSWTPASDADDERINYNVYINSELIEGPISRTNLMTTLEYNKDYEGKIIATDQNGGSSEIEFNFRSPTSKFLFVSDYLSGELLAIDLHTQKTVWTAPSGEEVHAIRNGLVFTGIQELSAYKILTGEKIWEAEPVFREYRIGYRHLMADDQFLFAKTSDDYLISIDLQRQEKQWEKSLFKSIYMFSMDRDHLYVPKRNNDDLISVNKVSGEVVWGFSLDRAVAGLLPEIVHAPLVYNGNLYFQDNNGRFYSVNKHTGIKNYSLFIGKDSESAPIGGNGNIIFAAHDELISLQAENGQINWRYNFGSYSRSSPFEENGLIYVGAGEELFCIDAHSGSLKWKTNLGGPIWSSPIVYDQKVYVSSHAANVFCINAISGSVEWRKGNVSFSVSSPTLVIGDTEEIVYPSNSRFYTN